MANPWDVPSIPSDGDQEEDSTYIGVGRVLSAWEHVELILSQIYSHFVGKTYLLEAFHEYGTGRIFAERFAKLTAAANRYFIKHCDQTLECQFCQHSMAIQGFSSRRNDIAHGIVRPVEWIYPSDGFNPSKQAMTFLLVPPHYDYKRFDDQNKPIYAYNKNMLISLENELFALTLQLLDLEYKVSSQISPAAPQ